MKETNYPRVLIIGQSFSGISGASITLRNLFGEWPKEKIAVASNNIDEYDKNTFKYCTNNYRLGNGEISVLAPFNQFTSLRESVILEKLKRKKTTKGTTNSQSIFKSIVKRFLIKTGLNSIRFRYELSEGFLVWYKTFNPQIVYSAVGDLDLIRFLLKIKSVDNVSIALHLWDDWPNTLADRTLLKRYWKNKFDKEFRTLINVSDKLLSISEAMSKEYQKLYNREFISFHNPINLEEWNIQNHSLNNEHSKTILYVGKINNDTFELLILMSRAIQIINSEQDKNQYIFHIYSPDKGGVLDRFEKYEGTAIFDAIPHEQVVKVLKNASILFLPLGFSKKNIRYTRLSMPTKVSEYMISASPIIVMAPSEIALTMYAKEYEWAEVIDKKDLQLLIDAIFKLSSQDSFVKDIITKAVSLAKEKHDAHIVRKHFKIQLEEVAKYE